MIQFWEHRCRCGAIVPLLPAGEPSRSIERKEKGVIRTNDVYNALDELEESVIKWRRSNPSADPTEQWWFSHLEAQLDRLHGIIGAAGVFGREIQCPHLTWDGESPTELARTWANRQGFRVGDDEDGQGIFEQSGKRIADTFEDLAVGLQRLNVIPGGESSYEGSGISWGVLDHYHGLTTTDEQKAQLVREAVSDMPDAWWRSDIRNGVRRFGNE